MNINNIIIDYITSNVVLFRKKNLHHYDSYYQARLIGPKISKRNRIRKRNYSKLLKRYSGKK